MYIFFLIDILSGQMKVHKDVKPVIYVKSAVRGSGSENIRFGIWYVTLFFLSPAFSKKSVVCQFDVLFIYFNSWSSFIHTRFQNNFINYHHVCVYKAKT